MWELDYEESWVLKNWSFWTVVLEKTLESPLNCKEIQSVHSTGDQYWIFIGRTDAEAETPIIWPPDAKNWLVGKDSDAGRDWGQEEKGMTEDEIVGWHHWLDGHESEQVPGVDDGQGSLVCCNPWCQKEWDTTEQLKWHVYMGFPGGSDGKESASNLRDLGSILGLGRSPGGEQGSPLQYSCLENPVGQRSLAGYSPWGHKESDTTEWLRADDTYTYMEAKDNTSTRRACSWKLPILPRRTGCWF